MHFSQSLKSLTMGKHEKSFQKLFTDIDVHKVTEND